MKSIGQTIAACVALLVVCAPSEFAVALDLYTNNVDDSLPGTNIRPADWFEFHGDAGVVFAEEVTAAGGVGGSQSYLQTLDTTGAASSFYFYSGFGQFAEFADDTQLLAGGVPGSADPARYRFSADVKVEGNNGSTGSTPLEIRVAAIDNDYEATHGINVNGDSDMTDGAAVYVPVVAPVIATSGQYVHVQFTMNQGTQDVDADIPVADRVFNNNLSLLWQVNFHQGGFAFDAGNSVSIDNIKIEFLESTAVAGDYNGNGVVDGADYVVWRNNKGLTGSPTAAQGNGDGDGEVDDDDYNYWRARFGNISGLGTGSTAVPEPATIVLIAAAAVLSVFRGARRPIGG